MDAIFGNRFFSNRVPAWHGKGWVMDEPMSAYAAFQLIGPTEVHLEDVKTETGLPLPNRAIVRSPTHDDPTPRVFGIVSKGYCLITPVQVCDAWDTAVNRPIETMGHLENGETFFLTTFLPTLSVKGDEIKSYLLMANPMNGGGAVQIITTPVRTVCQNTLKAAKQQASQTLRIVHTRSAYRKMQEWLSGVYDTAVAQCYAINADFARMADKRLNEKEADAILEQVYTMPSLPRKDAPKRELEKREAEHQTAREWTLTRRSAAKELFSGKGMGMDTPAAQGTSWGLYNSVAELEDHRAPRGSGDVTDSILFGERGKTIERAYEYCLAATK